MCAAEACFTVHVQLLAVAAGGLQIAEFGERALAGGGGTQAPRLEVASPHLELEPQLFVDVRANARRGTREAQVAGDAAHDDRSPYLASSTVSRAPTYALISDDWARRCLRPAAVSS